MRQSSAKAGMPSAAPGNGGAYAVAAIPVAGAGIDLLQDMFRTIAVAALHRGSKAIFGIAHQLHRFFIVAYFHNADHRAKRFFAHQLHIVGYVCQHGGLKVIAFVAAALAAGQ
jgi:hypothetical protein